MRFNLGATFAAALLFAAHVKADAAKDEARKAIQAKFDEVKTSLSKEVLEPKLRQDIKAKGYECGTACDGYLDTSFSEFDALVEAYLTETLARWDAAYPNYDTEYTAEVEAAEKKFREDTDAIGVALFAKLDACKA